MIGRPPEAPYKPYPVYSFPKAGRTWLAFLWYYYALAITGKQALAATTPPNHRAMLRPADTPIFRDVVWRELVERSLPIIGFHHFVRIGDRLPDMEVSLNPKLNRRHTVLVRSPGHILVSYFHHVKARQERFQGATGMAHPSDIVRSPDFGIERIIDYYRICDGHQGKWQTAVYYEDLVADTSGTFRRLLEYAGYRQIADAALDYAVESAGFERLHQMELDFLTRYRRRPNDQNDLRFRSGGGLPATGDDLPERDLDFITERLRQTEIGLLRRYH